MIIIIIMSLFQFVYLENDVYELVTQAVHKVTFSYFYPKWRPKRVKQFITFSHIATWDV